MRFASKFVVYWIIIAGALIILFGPGGIIDIGCIKCQVTGSWIIGLVSIVLGLAALAGNRALPGGAATGHR